MFQISRQTLDQTGDSLLVAFEVEYTGGLFPISFGSRQGRLRLNSGHPSKRRIFYGLERS
jgi:hypothetical protein